MIVSGRLEQRSWETPDGDKRSKVEVVADEIGPSIRWATAQVTKNERRAPGEGPSTTGGGRGGLGRALPQESDQTAALVFLRVALLDGAVDGDATEQFVVVALGQLDHVATNLIAVVRVDINQLEHACPLIVDFPPPAESSRLGSFLRLSSNRLL